MRPASEALDETRLMLEVYRRVVEGDMRMPVIPGEKSASERFPGADATYSIEAMMQDGKALQAGTSHFLGQNFAKAANIAFQTRTAASAIAYTTSWGASTRLIGALIMTHSDDDGLRLPPTIAPQQVVIVPILRDEASRAEVDPGGRDPGEAAPRPAVRRRAGAGQGRPARRQLVQQALGLDQEGRALRGRARPARRGGRHGGAGAPRRHRREAHPADRRVRRPGFRRAGRTRRQAAQTMPWPIAGRTWSTV